MLTLNNNQLTVEILDPIADSARFGVRYCTGGYIFQIHDARHGALLTGPTYPDSFNWFDGQGIPDAFNLAPLKSSERDPVALILGIGLCNLETKTISEPCQWQIEQGEDRLHFVTQHNFGDWSLTLERTVRLINRTVRSETTVHNTGRRPAPISWFPHPFFPQMPTDEDELIKLNLPVSFPASDAYEVSANGFICRKGWPWQQGYYQALDYASNSNLLIIQRHPALGQITATCSYLPTFFPIWGNPHTFSWEPFFERTLASGQRSAWVIDYDF